MTSATTTPRQARAGRRLGAEVSDVTHDDPFPEAASR